MNAGHFMGVSCWHLFLCLLPIAVAQPVSAEELAPQVTRPAWTMPLNSSQLDVIRSISLGVVVAHNTTQDVSADVRKLDELRQSLDDLIAKEASDAQAPSAGSAAAPNALPADMQAILKQASSGKAMPTAASVMAQAASASEGRQQRQAKVKEWAQKFQERAQFLQSHALAQRPVDEGSPSSLVKRGEVQRARLLARWADDLLDISQQEAASDRVKKLHKLRDALRLSAHQFPGQADPAPTPTLTLVSARPLAQPSPEQSDAAKAQKQK